MPLWGTWYGIVLNGMVWHIRDKMAMAVGAGIENCMMAPAAEVAGAHSGRTFCFVPVILLIAQISTRPAAKITACPIYAPKNYRLTPPIN